MLDEKYDSKISPFSVIYCDLYSFLQNIMMGINASRKERNAVRKDNLEDFGDDECLQARGQTMVEINGRFVNIPEEIVIVILSFLPVKDLEKCARVSPLFGTLVNSSSLWKLKCEREGKYVRKIMAPCYPSDWRKFYLKEPFSRNLIKNPSGNGRLNLSI